MAANDVETKFSPAWWMQILTDRQTKRLRDTYVDKFGTIQPGLDTLQAWMDNTPPLPEGAPDWMPAFQAFHRDTRTNVAALTVGSAANRMTALGFRTGASGDENGDDVAASVWDENQMAVEQVDVLTDMLALREGYTMVMPKRDGSTYPIITSEDPRQVITAHDPARRSVVRAGIKMLHDPDEEIDACYVYLPAGGPHDPTRATVYRAWRPAGRGTRWTPGFRFSAKQGWTWDEPERLPTRRVPITRLQNRRNKSEFEPHLSILGRINRITLQRMLIAEIQAFRQRAVEGLPDLYPEDYPVAEMRGKQIDYEGIFTPGPGSMWRVPPGVKFWESQPIDIRPLLDEEKMEYRTLSALIGIPVSYFNPDDTNGSADGASLQRESLTYRVEDRQTIASAGLNGTMSIAFEMMGDAARADVSKIETIWAPIERLSLTERYQSAVQARAAGLATDTIRREVLRMTPRQMKAAAADDARDRIRGVLPQGVNALDGLALQQRGGGQPPRQQRQEQPITVPSTRADQ